MFTGFSAAALDFYDDLEMDNTKSFWEAHRQTYDTEVAAPMKALMAELSTEFGEAKVFRPYRDVRFAKDKTPYKTAQGAFVAAGPSTGWYVQVGAPGVMVGAGFYEASAARLASVREAIVHDRHGPELERILDCPVSGMGPRWRHPQDVTPRLRRRPPAHRPASPQVDDPQQALWLRAVHPHPRAT